MPTAVITLKFNKYAKRVLEVEVETFRRDKILEKLKQEYPVFYKNRERLTIERKI